MGGTVTTAHGVFKPSICNPAFKRSANTHTQDHQSVVRPESGYANSCTTPIAVVCRGVHENPPEGGKNADCPLVGAEMGMGQSALVETKGIEPSFRRCDRRVLPLHHVPRDHKPHSMFYRLDVNR